MAPSNGVRLSVPLHRSRALVSTVVLVAIAFGAACRGSPAPAGEVRVEWTMTPSVAVAGRPVTGELRLRDAAQRPLRGAAIQVEGHMSHPGMAPVLATAQEREDGIYDVRLTFSMAGEWTLRVTGTLRDGRRVDYSVGVVGTRPAAG